MKPTADQALQFALMLESGIPSEEAIGYFIDEAIQDPQAIRAIHNSWMKSKQLQAAVMELQKKTWQEMSIEERIQYAINKHYSEMAYFLYSHNYGSLGSADKNKADTCRTTLEAKLAGLAGKMDALNRFWADITSGKLVLPKVVAADLKH